MTWRRRRSGWWRRTTASSSTCGAPRRPATQAQARLALADAEVEKARAPVALLAAQATAGSSMITPMLGMLTDTGDTDGYLHRASVLQELGGERGTMLDRMRDAQEVAAILRSAGGRRVRRAGGRVRARQAGQDRRGGGRRRAEARDQGAEDRAASRGSGGSTPRAPTRTCWPGAARRRWRRRGSAAACTRPGRSWATSRPTGR